MKDIKESSLDVRILDRNLATGRLEHADVKAHLEALEDCSEEADWTTTQMAMPPRVEPEVSED